MICLNPFSQEDKSLPGHVKRHDVYLCIMNTFALALCPKHEPATIASYDVANEPQDQVDPEYNALKHISMALTHLTMLQFLKSFKEMIEVLNLFSYS